jgi:hypothetical protein
MAKTTRRADSIVRLKVTLRNIRPPVWRRLLMPGGMTLGDLHLAIQAAMGWQLCHLHVFDVGGSDYGDPYDVDDVDDEERMTLNALVKSGVARFAYTYDFGDGWQHAIVVEGRQPPDEGRTYPACIAGKRRCPPEDCGGPWGYRDLLAILADPSQPDHAEQLEWIGGAFDPEDFSVAAADAMLAARFGLR